MREPLSRERLVVTARTTIEHDGVDGLSLRGLARELGVTAPALYAHVDGKDDLLTEIASTHFELLISRFDAIDDEDPLDRIRALCRAYVDHALDAPALFHLMFRFPPRPVGPVEAFPPAERAYAAAEAATRSAVESGALAVEDPSVASMAMWAAVHGVAEVGLLGFADRQAIGDLLDAVVDTMLVGFGAEEER
ncbi:MAG TPA: TetR/AcrR family transcriptional regulator [Microthrixaceae bacterium]|nr:TetR/AcrR family transcriptional regulator [Microthrixaceae bacterium]